MKYCIVVLFLICGINCNSEYMTVKAKVLYVEPGIQGHGYLTGLINPVDSEDSLAVKYDNHHTNFAHTVLLDRVYEFQLMKMEKPKPYKYIKPEKMTWIDSLPVVNMVDSSKVIWASEYWLVLSADSIK